VRKVPVAIVVCHRKLFSVEKFVKQR
jgi:hypothetical protein